MPNRYAPLSEYGLIGDLHTVALVGMDASIDYLCLPEFDSPSVFAALLDAERGGRFQIAPILHRAARKQLYLPDTNVLLTRFLDAEGVAEVSDFMPVEDAGRAHNIVRRAKTVRGEVGFRMRCDRRFDYARATHKAERRSETEVLFVGRSGDGELALRLLSSAPMRLENGAALAEFTLRADQSAWFVLEVVLPGEPSLSCHPDYPIEAFKDTVNFWRRWVARSTYGGRWREMVNRSALTLKLLTSKQHGSMVASPTFGLPEVIGGGRNWDYRYTWIRVRCACGGRMYLRGAGRAGKFCCRICRAKIAQDTLERLFAEGLAGLELRAGEVVEASAGNPRAAELTRLLGGEPVALSEVWLAFDRAEARRLVDLLVARIVVARDEVSVVLAENGDSARKAAPSPVDSLPSPHGSEGAPRGATRRGAEKPRSEEPARRIVEPKAYRISHVAALLDLPKSTVYDLVRTGALASIRTGTNGGVVLIPASAVAEFLEKKRARR